MEHEGEPSPSTSQITTEEAVEASESRPVAGLQKAVKRAKKMPVLLTSERFDDMIGDFKRRRKISDDGESSRFDDPMTDMKRRKIAHDSDSSDSNDDEETGKRPSGSEKVKSPNQGRKEFRKTPR